MPTRSYITVAARSSRSCVLLLHALVRDEEQRCSRCGAYYRRPNAIVDAAEAARCPEACRGLEPGLEGVEGEERGVYGCTRYAACLRLSVD